MCWDIVPTQPATLTGQHVVIEEALHCCPKRVEQYSTSSSCTEYVSTDVSNNSSVTRTTH